VGVSPRASPANISLNSSGEETSNTSLEEATPPLRVPYNTPQSGLPNNPRYPLINRLNESNILAQLEETVKHSAKTLEGFAKLRSPLEAMNIDSSERLFAEEDLAIGRDQHNAKERRRR
jgi:hypothetical protein